MQPPGLWRFFFSVIAKQEEPFPLVSFISTNTDKKPTTQKQSLKIPPSWDDIDSFHSKALKRTQKIYLHIIQNPCLNLPFPNANLTPNPKPIIFCLKTAPIQNKTKNSRKETWYNIAATQKIRCGTNHPCKNPR